MCGRTACTLAPDEVRRACTYRDKQGKRRKPEWRDGDQDKYKPSYNKSPQSNSPVLVSRKHFQKDADSSERLLATMRWGLVPSWFRENDPAKMQYSTNNCRSDGIMKKKSYKDPLLKGQRCVILADGFYEWQRQKAEKQPYFIYFPQTKEEQSKSEETAEEEWKGWRLLTMAGLFDCWQPPDGGEPLFSYTVITVDASKTMDSIHDRMPAILEGDEAIEKWLDFGKVPSQEAVKLIHPTEGVDLHPVSTIVNNSRNNTPECIKPIELGAKTQPELSASGLMMLKWLKTESPKKENSQDLKPKPASPSTREDSKRSKGSAGLMQMWLKQSEPPMKKPRTS
ncbi:abasic site processing protein HMCES [Latimeria chalumnae]|uniref:Abasic site processing protein HMCES n=1 Tax=Latimeria chalumnae TaxID=7897 RepID=H3B8N7_LATCH|nr:PREDICTED: embryonic stem cell-specific 5-hydroxymethylcytosine-binding protein [Latimeria chalumnae]|eukprot:XP_005992610.1 PREDICTED: embryonic stem cell-specific 5-hydroxymethylcytosine-binding protein [Latimeria chalumnae]